VILYLCLLHASGLPWLRTSTGAVVTLLPMPAAAARVFLALAPPGSN
jgi:hypothetical protein